MARRRRQRGEDVDGVVLVDKPAGLTSRDVSERCRRAWNAKKAGHTGTLDPMATGLLVVCLGTATRFVPYLTGLDKAYEAVLLLGYATSTDDAEGEPLGPPVPVEAGAVRAASAALRSMEGSLSQVPPRVSAIKVDGKRSHERARSGEEFELAPRDVQIHDVAVGEPEGARVPFAAHVSKGTFIRSMARDAGEAAGCGGHLAALRRTRVGALDVTDAVPLERLEQDASARDGALRTPFEALAHLAMVDVDADATRRLSTGQRPRLALAEPPGTVVRVRDEASGAFVGLAVVESCEQGTRLRAERLNPT